MQDNDDESDQFRRIMSEEGRQRRIQQLRNEIQTSRRLLEEINIERMKRKRMEKFITNGLILVIILVWLITGVTALLDM